MRPPVDHVTGVILAGGQSRRFGSDKAFALYRGRTFLERGFRLMRGLFKNVVIVANHPEKMKRFEVPVLQDEVPFRGPAGAIVTALKHAGTDAIFVVACDMPLLSQKIIRDLLEKDDGSDAVFYRHEKRIEPLCAIYRRSLIPLLETRLASGRNDLQSLLEENMTFRIIPLEASGRRALTNVNTPEELGARLSIGSR